VADHIVLVGSSAAGLNDLKATPIAPDMPGVEIHAHAIDTLVRGDHIRPAPVWLSVVLSLALAPVGAWLVLRLRALRAFAAVAAVWVVLAVVTFLAFTWSQVWLRHVGPSLALALGYAVTSIEHFIREQREKRRLSQFFSPDVLREIVRHGEIACEVLEHGGAGGIDGVRLEEARVGLRRRFWLEFGGNDIEDVVEMILQTEPVYVSPVSR